MQKSQWNKLQHTYLEMTYSVGGARFSPLDQESDDISFLASNGIISWAIIILDDRNRLVELEGELNSMRIKYESAKSYVKDQRQEHKQGFFLRNVTVNRSIRIAKSYGLKAVYCGDETGLGQYEWILPDSEEQLERLLMTRVKGCGHRRHCTTGCWEREARVLKLNKVDPERARKLIEKWRAEGIPQKYLNELEFPNNLFIGDLSYKESVIDVLEGMINRNR